jgi:hypothetical protein
MNYASLDGSNKLLSLLQLMIEDSVVKWKDAAKTYYVCFELYVTVEVMTAMSIKYGELKLGVRST